MKFEERGKNIDHKKALIWLLSSADKMKNEIENINNFFSKNNLKPEKIKVSNQKVENMNEACRKIDENIKKYEKTKDWVDLNTACSAIEMIIPSFHLNYNEIMEKIKVSGYKF